MTVRDEALRRARTRITEFNRDALPVADHDPKGVLTRDEVTCTFVRRVPGGTSLKFDCALDDGEISRVKYGHQPEVFAEVAATRLLAALGYAADHVYMVRRVHCRGCPMNPFVTMLLLDAIGDPSNDVRCGCWRCSSRTGTTRLITSGWSAWIDHLTRARIRAAIPF